MSNVLMPISADVLYDEIESAEKLLAKWKGILNEGLPGLDIPASDAEVKFEAVMREMTGELFLASGKLQNLAVILAER